MRATVFSIYFPNIVEEVREKQRLCIEKFLPEGWTFGQFLHTPQQGDNFSHATALQNCVELNGNDITILLDIDCIPLSKKSFAMLAEGVLVDDRKGLVGIVQRANHIQNNKHLYIGPACMAFSKAYYKDLGSPSFAETNRGDAGEELTYCWTDASGFSPRPGGSYYRYPKNVHFIWPLSCLQPVWDLDYGFKFGFGTTYGAAGAGPLFYHQFNIRVPEMQKFFVRRCDEILSKEREAVS